MPDNEFDNLNIPVLKDVVVPVTQTPTVEETAKASLSEQGAAPNSSLLSSTLQEEIDAIIEQARTDFEATIATALSEMQQRIERELKELQIQLTSDD